MYLSNLVHLSQFPNLICVNIAKCNITLWTDLPTTKSNIVLWTFFKTNEEMKSRKCLYLPTKCNDYIVILFILNPSPNALNFPLERRKVWNLVLISNAEPRLWHLPQISTALFQQQHSLIFLGYALGNFHKFVALFQQNSLEENFPKMGESELVCGGRGTA